MALLAFLLAAQTVAPADTLPPYLAFPEPGLDDPAAYEGYTTRVYQDASDNAFQVYLKGNTGRVVNLWADAANESVGFTVRDSSGKPAELVWGSSGAVVTGSAHTRSVSYGLELPSTATVGLFLLGSMRVERDFQYAGRDTLPLDAASFPQHELSELIDHIAKLKPAERTRHLSLLGVKTVDGLRARLLPHIVLTPHPPLRDAERGSADTTWSVRVEQVSFDGKSHLVLALEGDSRETGATVSGRTVTIRRPAGGPVRLTVRVTTDAPALTPLKRAEIFNDEFRRFAAQVRADTAHPLRFRRLEREVRGVELLCYREKLMAGLPNFATYFGRDMLMTALLMEPIWSDTMAEHVIAAALAKLAPTGEVSHEEALGGQAIRENAAEYNRTRDPTILTHLGAVRENYMMVDDDFQLPVVTARYLVNPAVPATRKRRFVTRWRLALLRNLAFVARSAAPYAAAPVATNLVSFRRLEDGWWHAGSWRDSRVGYAGGRFAFDVNVVWVPAALSAIGAIDSTLRALGFAGVPDAPAVAAAVQPWRGTARHFEVALAPATVEARVRGKLASLPAAERAYWETVLARSGFPTDTLRFLALALDAVGRPIPVMSTDPVMLLVPLEAVPAARYAEMLRPFTLPYPLGLLVDGLGPVVANDAYAPPAVWQMFERDLYHSPRVVWGREVNMLLTGLARRARRPLPPLVDAVRDAVEQSGLRHAELWSYTIENGRLVPSRYGTSSDVQLWSLTDLAVQYLLNTETP
jgi:hypothetical protein